MIEGREHRRANWNAAVDEARSAFGQSSYIMSMNTRAVHDEISTMLRLAIHGRLMMLTAGVFVIAEDIERKIRVIG